MLQVFIIYASLLLKSKKNIEDIVGIELGPLACKARALPLNQLPVGKQRVKLLFILNLLHASQVKYVTVGVKIAGCILLVLRANIATVFLKVCRLLIFVHVLRQ